MIQLYDDTGLSTKPVVTRAAFETPFIEEPLGHEGKYQVAADGGLYTAAVGEHRASIIVAPKFRGRTLAELGHSPELGIWNRSLHSVVVVVHMAGLWGQARLSGGLLSELRQRSVMESMMSELVRLICGDNWARAEESFLANSGSRALETLAEATSRNPDETAMRAALVRASEIAASAAPCDRVRILTSLAINHRLLPDRLLRKTIDSQDAERFDTPKGLSELALRLASDPANVEPWGRRRIAHRTEAASGDPGSGQGCKVPRLGD